jgi:fatty-acyl-CoA synthase
MMKTPLITSDLIEYAEQVYPDTAVFSRENNDQIEQSRFGQVALNSRSLASALEQLGLNVGDRVGALAWSTLRYLELFYGVPGMGAVLHTINPRLHSDDLAYIINDARNVALCVDRFTWQAASAIAGQLPTVQYFIWLDDPAEMPGQHGFKTLIAYDELLTRGDKRYPWPALDEDSGCTICYTSGTTGRPKGVVYTHRGNVLLTLSATSKGFFGYPQSTGAAQSFLSLTGMFHGNAWMMPFAAPLMGAKLLLAGRDYTPEKLHQLMDAGQATLAAGVPTILQTMVDYVQQKKMDFGSLTKVVLAGTRPPRDLVDTLEQDYGVDVGQAWGMTEGQMGSMPVLTQQYNELNASEKIDKKFRGGLINFGIKMQLIDDDGNNVDFDGKTPGHLLIKGPWVIASYLNHSEADRSAYTTQDGWFRTGDIACIHPDGYLEIVDRAKDLIKSGGEWICSAVIESLVNAAPDVVESAVIGIPDRKWQERPMLFVVKKTGSAIDEASIKNHLAGKIANWWMPEKMQFVESLPKTGTGKVSKKELRERYDS